MGTPVASSTGSQWIYVRVVPVLGNLVPVEEGVLDNSLWELKAAFIRLLLTAVGPALRWM